MGQRRGPAPAGEHEARLQQRQIEAGPVERHHRPGAGQQRLQRREQRGLVVEVAHEVLDHHDPVVLDERGADEEGVGAGAAGQAGRLGVEEE